jgi:hypothetical protein
MFTSTPTLYPDVSESRGQHGEEIEVYAIDRPTSAPTVRALLSLM